MPLPLAAMAVGAGLSLLATAIGDLLSSDELDPAQVQAVDDAKQSRIAELMEGGASRVQAEILADAEARKIMESMAPEGVGVGDYALSGAIGAATGFIPGVGAAVGKAGGKLASFLGKLAPNKAAPVADDVYRAGFVSSGRDAARRGALDRVSSAAAPDGPVLRLTGPSTRGVPVGPGVQSTPFDGASSKLPPLRTADVWPEDAAIAGNIGRKAPKTIDTTAEVIQGRIGMGDDAMLNEVDDIIEQAMAQSPARLGMQYRMDPRKLPRRSFLTEFYG